MKTTKGQPKNRLTLCLFVGAERFELSTPCSQSRCANRAALRPEVGYYFFLKKSQIFLWALRPEVDYYLF